jgi:hypothetical protein
MEIKPASHTMIKRLVPTLALWLTTKILESPRIKGQLAEVDSATFVGRRRAGRAIKRVAKNAKRNPAWLAASAAAFAVAIGCIAKAGSRKR